MHCGFFSKFYGTHFNLYSWHHANCGIEDNGRVREEEEEIATKFHTFIIQLYLFNCYKTPNPKSSKFMKMSRNFNAF